MYRQENRKNKFGSSKWKEGMAEQTYRYSLLGATHEQIATFFKVSKDTISYWLINNVEFAEAFNRGKMEADAKVAEAWYRSACGYDYVETKTYTNKHGEVSTEVTTKHVPPNPMACVKWMAIRQRELWAEVSKSEHISYSTNVDIKYVVDQLKDRTKFSDDDLQFALKYGLKTIAIAENAGVENN